VDALSSLFTKQHRHVRIAHTIHGICILNDDAMPCAYNSDVITVATSPSHLSSAPSAKMMQLQSPTTNNSNTPTLARPEETR
jgi:hypothetical protein